MIKLNLLRKSMLILITVIFFFLFTSFWGFYTSIKPPKLTSQISPTNLGLDYEEISFVTNDNLTLRGWFIPRQNSGQVPNPVSRETAKSLRPFEMPQGKQARDKTIILLHGYPADKGNILPGLSFLSEKFNLLLFDFRYLGTSDGKYSTAGAKETEDLTAAIRFLKSRDINEVGVWGFSLGGAVALMTAPQSPEIKAIVSESSYARLDLLTSQIYTTPYIRYILGYLTSFWAKIFLGIDAKSVSPEKSVQNLTIPILLIHSTNDSVILFSHALRLQEALKNNPKAEFWFQENLVHGQFAEGYQQRIEGFFEKSF